MADAVPFLRPTTGSFYRHLYISYTLKILYIILNISTTATTTIATTIRLYCTHTWTQMQLVLHFQTPLLPKPKPCLSLKSLFLSLSIYIYIYIYLAHSLANDIQKYLQENSSHHSGNNPAENQSSSGVHTSGLVRAQRPRQITLSDCPSVSYNWAGNL